MPNRSTGRHGKPTLCRSSGGSECGKFYRIGRYAVDQKVLVVERALPRQRTDEIGLQNGYIVAVKVDVRRIIAQKNADLIGRKHLQRLLVAVGGGALRLGVFHAHLVGLLPS